MLAPALGLHFHSLLPALHGRDDVSISRYAHLLLATDKATVIACYVNEDLSAFKQTDTLPVTNLQQRVL